MNRDEVALRIFLQLVNEWESPGTTASVVDGTIKRSFELADKFLQHGEKLDAQRAAPLLKK